MTELQKRVYDALSKYPDGVTPHLLAISMGYKFSSPIFPHLLALKRKGFVIKEGKAKQTKYKIRDVSY